MRCVACLMLAKKLRLVVPTSLTACHSQPPSISITTIDITPLAYRRHLSLGKFTSHISQRSVQTLVGWSVSSSTMSYMATGVPIISLISIQGANSSNLGGGPGGDNKDDKDKKVGLTVDNGHGYMLICSRRISPSTNRHHVLRPALDVRSARQLGPMLQRSFLKCSLPRDAS